MNTIFDIQIPLIVNILSQNGINVSPSERFEPVFFPEMNLLTNNEYVLKYDQKEETLLSLYNAVMLYGVVPYSCIVDYVLFYVYLERFDYTNAEKHLNLFRDAFCNVKIKRDEDCLSFQILFSILHEMYHILFMHMPELKLQASNCIKNIADKLKREWADFFENMDDKTRTRLEKETEEHIRNMISQSLPIEVQKQMASEMRKNIFENHIVPKDFDILINDPNGKLAEEFACDMYAWHYIMQELKNQNTSEQEIIEVNKWVFVALNAMLFNQWVLKHSFRPIDRKNIYNGKEIVIRQQFYKEHLRFLDFENKNVRSEYKAITTQLEEMLSNTITILQNTNSLYEVNNDKGKVDRIQDMKLKRLMNEIIHRISM